jgi:hypothetical protein
MPDGKAGGGDDGGGGLPGDTTGAPYPAGGALTPLGFGAHNAGADAGGPKMDTAEAAGAPDGPDEAAKGPAAWPVPKPAARGPALRPTVLPGWLCSSYIRLVCLLTTCITIYM